ncbi:MAG: 1,2-phenylacetyl-CoA epoxidase subunit PaaC [Candidatus Promineifilaceae bacterium]
MVAEHLTHALLARLTAFADDELILAHRNSEWVGHAPILEEDIAIANVAQDELGHAMLFYQMVEALGGESGDRLAFFRNSAEFRNVQYVELPKGDWAFTILRQYLFDAYQFVLYAQLAQSTYQPLADAAEKIRKEELYHLRHTHVWVERLGLGSAEANRRMQAALDQLWPFAAQLFLPLASDEALVAAGIIPDVSQLREGWEQIVLPHLAESALLVNSAETTALSRSDHTPHLDQLLADMQLVARADPEATW